MSSKKLLVEEREYKLMKGEGRTDVTSERERERLVSIVHTFCAF